MAKKPVKEEVQFIKFIKKLYQDEIQLNFDEYFILNVVDGNINLIFPKDKYYRLYGSLEITEADSFKEWLTKTNCSVRINNKDLDLLRKMKLKSFLSVETSDNKYKINLDPEEQTTFELIKEDPITIDTNYEYKYEKEIPSNLLLDNSLFVASLSDNKEIVFSDSCSNGEILFDSAIKNFKNIFKKDATYTFYATDKDHDGFRIIMIQGKGNTCKLNQYFRVI